ASKLNAYRDYLTDAVITQRDGRYCLPVKAEYKSKVPGMVHDMSSTGMTLFIEPMAVVNLNNRIRELMSEEQKEIDKVLQELSAGLAPYTDVIADDISLLKKLDMIFAKALYSAEIGGTEPQFSKDLSIDLRSARHPLIEKDKVVPIDVRLGRDYDLLIVTGPNTGGKTVSLKTTGLLTLMGQSGLHIPADEGSVLGIFDDIYADIGDEQSIEQSLSTFSSHMKNIVRILKKADSRSLCLFDELGSGTDPTEGAALGIAILDFLHNMKTRVIATTHYSEIKLYALETEGVENACCEFDVQTLKPTYRLLIGIPGRSNAFAISKRLGLPDYIIEEAKRHIAAENESFEDIIRQLNDDRVRMEKAKAETEAAKQEISSLRGRIRKKEERLDESREKILNEAREEAQKILREAKETADMAIREIQKASSGKERAGASDAEAARDLLREGIKKHETRQPVQQKGPSRPVSARKLQLGDEVRVLSMGGMTGTVTALPDKDGIISVQLGFMNSRVNVREIELVKEADKNGGSTGGRRDAGGPKTASGGVTKSFGMKSMTVSPEINLIGMTTDEALPELEKYLDDAYLARLSSVRVVHGRGTGALKNMVHQRLRKLKYVDSFRLGTFGEGDTGVTIVTFK
ncbi:MAG: endonuclease MutS2, partial [Lachnospiraceae bacterium]|nr:endonuclease MutS2 [Lachnospiraceae bacterium]